MSYLTSEISIFLYQHIYFTIYLRCLNIFMAVYDSLSSVQIFDRPSEQDKFSIIDIAKLPSFWANEKTKIRQYLTSSSRFFTRFLIIFAGLRRYTIFISQISKKLISRKGRELFALLRRKILAERFYARIIFYSSVPGFFYYREHNN